MDKMTGEVYGVVRENLEVGREWLDLNSIRFILSETVAHADYIDGFIPDYAKEHPVKRFVKCSVTEIEEVARG